MNDKKTQAANSPERLPLTSADMTDALISQLRDAAPQIFSEGRVDFAKLQAALGEHIETNPERYGLTWAGTLTPSPSPTGRGELTPRPSGEGGRRPGEGGCGFRAFKLDSSNFKIWRSDKAPQSAEQLAEQLSLYADNVLAERGDQDRLYELILKCGMPLSARVEEVSLPVRAELVEAHPSTGSGGCPTKSFMGRTAFSVSDGNLLICLESHLDRDTLRALFARKPQMVLCLDTSFDGNDALKTNTVLEAQPHGIIFKTV